MTDNEVNRKVKDLYNAVKRQKLNETKQQSRF